MHQFRVTKYDPAHRDTTGAYLLDDWTSSSDVGRVFGGTTLTPERYQAVEDAYVSTALSFLSESGISHLRVAGLESRPPTKDAPSEGDEVSLEALEVVLRGLLRERFWCRLEAANGFIHVGWDYYMYVGVPQGCPAASAAASAQGLFVESFPSPYAASAA